MDSIKQRITEVRMTTHVSLSEILEADWLRQWRPEVVVDGETINTAVRWLQVVETLEGAAMTRPGDVALSTGGLLGNGRVDARRLARLLAECGAIALLVAADTAYDEAAQALVEECRAHRLALVTLHPSLCVAEVAERVQRLLAGRDVEDLALSDEIRTRFTMALRRRAQVGELLAIAAEYGDCPIALESPARKLLAMESGPWRRADAIQLWYRMRGSPMSDGPEKPEPENCIVAEVGSSEGPWGFLALCGYTGPRRRGVLLAERAAEAISVRRMLTPGEGRSEESGADLLQALVEEKLEPDEARIRLRQAGLLASDFTVAVCIRRVSGGEQARRGEPVSAVVTKLLYDLDLRSLAYVGRHDTATVLLAVPDSETAGAVRERISAWLSKAAPYPVYAGVCDRAVEPTQLGGVIREAELVAKAAQGLLPSTTRRLVDIRLRVLLTQLGTAPALHRFLGVMITPLIAPGPGPQLKDLLWTYLSTDGNKSITAQLHHVSRPTLYRRLRRIETLLDIDLSNAEDRVALYIALLADRLAASTSHPVD
ncbi:helix-turn-helix domain-containing protein [Streptomyces sp. 900116325]